jgi:hypothetical protein
MLPVFVDAPTVRLPLPEATVIASLTVRAKLDVFPTMVRSFEARCVDMTDALILAVPVTVKVFPDMLQFVPAVPVWPVETIVNVCAKVTWQTMRKVRKTIPPSPTFQFLLKDIVLAFNVILEETHLWHDALVYNAVAIVNAHGYRTQGLSDSKSFSPMFKFVSTFYKMSFHVFTLISSMNYPIGLKYGHYDIRVRPRSVIFAVFASFLSLGLICFPKQIQGQLRDTGLLSLYSKPFFYNVLGGSDGRIYAGTSMGIYRMYGGEMELVDRKAGYLTLDSSGQLRIDPNGIKHHSGKSYHHLLPYPQEAREEYHAGTSDYFYITSGGRMHVFEIRPYAYGYRNHSVRTISRNFVGTYSGIYHRGRRLTSQFASFSDGYIRELNGKAFICYSFLDIADMHGGDSLPTVQPFRLKGFDFRYVSDVLYSERFGRYFTVNRSQLGSFERDLVSAETLYTYDGKDGELVLLGESKAKVFFAAGRNLMCYNPVGKEVVTVAALPEEIMAGQLGPLVHTVVCRNGLYAVQPDHQTTKLAALSKAHSIVEVNPTEFAIATDGGLFVYNTVTKQTRTLIDHVEFNRRGLYLEGDLLHAGSINGLYVIDTRDFTQLSDMQSRLPRQKSLPGYLIAALSLAAVGVAVLLVQQFRNRRQIRELREAQAAYEKPAVGRDDVEQFIARNLSTVTVTSIAENFQMRPVSIYNLLAPEKPGSIINRLRMLEVQRMRKEGKTAREIAESTGFSISYVRKIWNR